jgi:outer membrane protein assembly factor BamE (lipoprotein component of BamABCDE complex)
MHVTKAIRMSARIMALSVIAALLPLHAGLNAAERTLQERVIELERQLRELRERVGELERRLQPQEVSPPPGPTAGGNWRDRRNWQTLQRGMTTDQVRALLGEPEYIGDNPIHTYWRYGSRDRGAHVLFDKASMKVNSWEEPR